MNKNALIFYRFSILSIKTVLQHPLSIVLFTLGKLLRFLLFFLFIFYLLKSTKMLAGYTLNETMLFYLSYNVVESMSQLLFREVYRFRQLVVSGELDAIIVKPYHPFIRILIGGVDLLDFITVIIYIAITIVIINQIPSLTILGVVSYISLLLNSLLIAAAFHIGVLAFGILSTEVDHTIMIYRDISRMGSFPIDIYHQPLQFILTFVLPIGIMLTVPVKGLLHTLPIWLFVTSFVFGSGLFLASLKLWNYSLLKYQSWGG